MRRVFRNVLWDKLNVMETIMLLDGSVDWKVGDPLCGALVNFPMALSMPGWPEAIFILIVAVLLFGGKKLPDSRVVLAKPWGNSRRRGISRARNSQCHRSRS